MRLVIVGTGYVGLVTGACLAYLGHAVTCVDADAVKVDALREGEVPFHEPGLPALLQRVARGEALDGGTLGFGTDLAAAVREAEVVFVAVGTPPGPGGEPDLRDLEAVGRAIGAALAQRPAGAPAPVVVTKSTVPVGSGNWVEMLVREGFRERQVAPVGGTGRLESAPAPCWVASNPEFLREGTAVADTLYPDRIVVGGPPEALAVLRRVYARILAQDFPAPGAIAPRPDRVQGPVPMVTPSLPSAELLKYAANAFLATKISFANELATLCERVGADVAEVMDGIGLDPRIGRAFLDAGVGWGGSCLGKDVGALVALAREYGISPRLLEATLDVNDAQRQRVVQKLQEQLKILKGTTVGLLGLAFKPGTDDLRDAPAIDVAGRLLRKGVRVKVHDPVAMGACRRQHPDLPLAYALDPLDLAADCDALVLITEWPDYARLDLAQLREAMRTPLLVDARNLYDPATVRGLGFTYVGTGR